MKTLTLAILAACLLFGQSAPKTYTGVITDTMCGADHAARKVKVTGTLFEKMGVLKVDKIESAQ